MYIVLYVQYIYIYIYICIYYAPDVSHDILRERLRAGVLEAGVGHVQAVHDPSYGDLTTISPTIPSEITMLIYWFETNIARESATCPSFV